MVSHLHVITSEPQLAPLAIAARAALEEVLKQSPVALVILFEAKDSDIGYAALPHSGAVMRGMIDLMHEELHAEPID